MKIITAIQAAIGVLAAAAAILKSAADFATRFVTKNTPESALIAALATTYQGWSTGALPTSAAAIMAFGALMTFAVAESAKDAKTAGAAANN